ncbi:DUF6004 family protein [Streptomyces sp. NPDC093089]|uniref:DUF6004 family protein n=1 Tax=Streptomyces sp. NPDC093089 TaxID=3366024 RepID=UPI00381A464D
MPGFEHRVDDQGYAPEVVPAPGVLRGTNLPEAWYPADDECAEPGGRVMLRASWARPSGGAFGKGDEDSLARLRFPADLHLDTYLELVTPRGALYADAAVPLAGRAADLESKGTELRAESDVPLVAEDGTAKARLADVKLVMRDTSVGETATVNTD